MLRQRQLPGSRLAFATILIALTAIVPRTYAETSSSSSTGNSSGNSGPDFNPNYAPPQKRPEDRKDEAKDASNKAAQSIPPLLGKAAEHMKNAKEHNDKAGQLQQSDPGQADSERKQAAMEQQMANQLKQQADQNKKNSDDNQKASEAAKSDEKVKGKNFGGADKISSKVDENKVINVDEARQSGSNSQLGAKTPKIEEKDPLKKELATFEDYVPPKRAVAEATPAVVATPAATAASSDQTSFLKPEWNSILAGAGGSATQVGQGQAPGGETPATAGASTSPPASAGAPPASGSNFGSAMPAILAGGGGEIGRGLDKDFFKDKERDPKNKKKNVVARRTLASKWKGTKIRRVEAELEADAPPPLLTTQPDIPLPKSGKLKD